MGSFARSMMRAQAREKDRTEAVEYRHSERWNELLEFCRHHSICGEIEFQSSEAGDYVECLLCSKSFECDYLPAPLLCELLRRFRLSMWLEM